jgi:hypothetical protein
VTAGKGPPTATTTGGAKGPKVTTAGYPPIPPGWWVNPWTQRVEPRPPP